VQALAKAHDLLVRKRIAGISLEDLVKEQVHLGGNADPRISMLGREVVVAGRDAMHLALVLHELATNARKYGALSAEQPSGRLGIHWNVVGAPSPRLELRWEESGVAGMKVPEHKGFGSRLIERLLEGSGGEANIFIGADGLRCDIKLPLEEEQSSRTQSNLAPRSIGRRILIVEDEPLIAMELEEVLTSTGFSIVGPAATVSAALRMIATEAFDAALLDANLGGQPVDEIAAALTRKNVPFVFATGHDRDGLPRSFAAAPILRKPFNPAEVAATVAEILEPAALALRARDV
jgi:CheY-like chemotaxis protein